MVENNAASIRPRKTVTETYTILIVDDEKDLLELFGAVLTRQKFAVRKASSSAEAQAALEQEMPDLMVLDLAMPEVTGVELLRMLRNDERYVSLPVVILTAIPVMIDKKDADLANAVLTKPITPHELSSTISSILGI